MALIKLTEGFSLIPEGTHIFKITGVKHDENFGKVEINMQTQRGQKHIERFRLLNANGSPNEAAYNAFSYFARAVMNNFALEEADPLDFVGKFVEAEVEHEVVPNRDNPDKTVTFIRLSDKRPSEGWTEDKPPFDLKALLK